MEPASKLAAPHFMRTVPFRFDAAAFATNKRSHDNYGNPMLFCWADRRSLDPSSSWISWISQRLVFILGFTNFGTLLRRLRTLCFYCGGVGALSAGQNVIGNAPSRAAKASTASWRRLATAGFLTG